MNQDDLTPVGRLAFRQEGNVWVCYYAQKDTMEDALFLGSISMGLAQQPGVQLAFMDRG